MASNCDKFYLVVSGDECGTIATNEGISLADLYAWNLAVGTSCEYLDLCDYVCVDVIGATVTATSTATSTSSGNGILQRLRRIRQAWPPIVTASIWLLVEMSMLLLLAITEIPSLNSMTGIQQLAQVVST
jgi:hypothetical protein